MSTIVDAVAAWRERCAACTVAFDAYANGARALIKATGGTYVTTSPDENGYCKDYEVRPDVDYILEGVTHEAPQHPEVGDKCFALEMAFREKAYAVNDAVDEVVRLARERAGSAANKVKNEALFAAVIALMADAA